MLLADEAVLCDSRMLREKFRFNSVWNSLSSGGTVLLAHIPNIVQQLEVQIYRGFLTENPQITSRMESMIRQHEAAKLSPRNSVYLTRSETFEFLLHLLSDCSEINIEDTPPRHLQSKHRHSRSITTPRSVSNVYSGLDSIIQQSSTFNDDLHVHLQLEQAVAMEEVRISTKIVDNGPNDSSECYSLIPVDSEEFSDTDDDMFSLMELGHKRSFSYPSTIHESQDDDKLSIKELMEHLQQFHEQLTLKFNSIEIYLHQVKLQNSRDRDKLNDLDYRNEQMLQKMHIMRVEVEDLARKLNIHRLESDTKQNPKTVIVNRDMIIPLPQPDESHKLPKSLARLQTGLETLVLSLEEPSRGATFASKPSISTNINSAHKTNTDTNTDSVSMPDSVSTEVGRIGSPSLEGNALNKTEPIPFLLIAFIVLFISFAYGYF